MRTHAHTCTHFVHTLPIQTKIALSHCRAVRDTLAFSGQHLHGVLVHLLQRHHLCLHAMQEQPRPLTRSGIRGCKRAFVHVCMSRLLSPHTLSLSVAICTSALQLQLINLSINGLDPCGGFSHARLLLLQPHV